MVNIHELRMIHENSWRESYPQFARVLRDHGAQVGAEIGVAFGGHAEAILENTRVRCLYGVDSYQHRQDYDDPMNLDQDDFDHVFWYAIGRLSRFGERYVGVRAVSKLAAEHLPGDLDFVYLDAEHSYQAVAEDVRTWLAKIRSGGIIGGHDYGGEAGFDGVQQAVDEVCRERGMQLHLEPGTVWWAVKS